MWGSIYRFDGQASVFWADARATTRPATAASTPSRRRRAWCRRCAEGGVLGVLCASIGSIQVNEAIKLLTGIGEPLLGKLMIYDALEMEYRKLKVRKDPNCALCGDNPTVTELIDYDAFCGAICDEAADAAAGSTISVTDLEHMLKEREKGDARLRAGRRTRAQRVRDQPDPGLGADPQGRVPQRQRAASSCPYGQAGRAALQDRRPLGRGARGRSRAPGYADAVHVGGGVVAWVEPDRPVPAVVLSPT